MDQNNQLSEKIIDTVVENNNLTAAPITSITVLFHRFRYAKVVQLGMWQVEKALHVSHILLGMKAFQAVTFSADSGESVHPNRVFFDPNRHNDKGLLTDDRFEYLAVMAH